MLQKFESYPDTQWDYNCQYFKVDGVEFPVCTMINDGEYILNLADRKQSASDEVGMTLFDYPTFEMFHYHLGSTIEEFDIFQKFNKN